MAYRELVIPDPLRRGIYCTGFYLNGDSLLVFAVNSAHQCVRQAIVSTRAELRDVKVEFERALDEIDPLRTTKLYTPVTVAELERIGRAYLDGAAPAQGARRRARKGEPKGRPAPPLLQLVR